MALKCARGKLVLGLTGSFGSGKSTVAGMFQALGAKVLDADRIAHGLYKPGTRVHARIRNAFGHKALNEDGAIDRARLGRLAFGNGRLLLRLNRITHPEIARIIKKKIKASDAALTVLDAPVLIEAGLKKLADVLIVVDIRKATQIARVRARTGLARQAIAQRIAHQMPLRNKVRSADFVIDNNGARSHTRKQVKRIWEQITRQGPKRRQKTMCQDVKKRGRKEWKS